MLDAMGGIKNYNNTILQVGIRGWNGTNGPVMFRESPETKQTILLNINNS
jgi:hypothetical protein